MHVNKCPHHAGPLVGDLVLALSEIKFSFIVFQSDIVGKNYSCT